MLCGGCVCVLGQVVFCEGVDRGALKFHGGRRVGVFSVV